MLLFRMTTAYLLTLATAMCQINQYAGGFPWFSLLLTLFSPQVVSFATDFGSRGASEEELRAWLGGFVEQRVIILARAFRRFQGFTNPATQQHFEKRFLRGVRLKTSIQVEAGDVRAKPYSSHSLLPIHSKLQSMLSMSFTPRLQRDSTACICGAATFLSCTRIRSELVFLFLFSCRLPPLLKP